MPGFFTPTKKKLSLVIIVMILYLLFAALTKSCPVISRLCYADSSTPGAHKLQDGSYGISARHVPLSCDQVCSTQKYYSTLIMNILLQIMLPVLASYFLACAIFSPLGIKK